jgi:hypothetical protein
MNSASWTGLNRPRAPALCVVMQEHDDLIAPMMRAHIFGSLQDVAHGLLTNQLIKVCVVVTVCRGCCDDASLLFRRAVDDCVYRLPARRAVSLRRSSRSFAPSSQSGRSQRLRMRYRDCVAVPVLWCSAV